MTDETVMNSDNFYNGNESYFEFSGSAEVSGTTTDCADLSDASYPLASSLFNCGSSLRDFRVACWYCSLISYWEISLWEEEPAHLDIEVCHPTISSIETLIIIELMTSSAPTSLEIPLSSLLIPGLATSPCDGFSYAKTSD